MYGQWRYWVWLGFLALALLSKSMAVSLPAVLVVLDAYPQAPFTLLSLRAGAVALVALGRGASPIVRLGWLDRATISLHSLAFYLWKMSRFVDAGRRSWRYG